MRIGEIFGFTVPECMNAEFAALILNYLLQELNLVVDDEYSGQIIDSINSTEKKLSWYPEKLIVCEDLSEQIEGMCGIKTGDIFTHSLAGQILDCMFDDKDFFKHSGYYSDHSGFRIPIGKRNGIIDDKVLFGYLIRIAETHGFELPDKHMDAGFVRLISQYLSGPLNSILYKRDEHAQILEYIAPEIFRTTSLYKRDEHAQILEYIAPQIFRTTSRRQIHTTPSDDLSILLSSILPTVLQTDLRNAIPNVGCTLFRDMPIKPTAENLVRLSEIIHNLYDTNIGEIQRSPEDSL
jgi:hypothetical protein